MKKRLLAAIVGLCLSLACVTDIYAELIAYEGFDVAGVQDGDEVSGLEGESSFGFAAPWRMQSGYTRGISFVSSNLEGNEVRPLSLGGSVWQDPGFRIYRDFSEAVGSEAGTYYISFVMIAGYQSALDFSYGSDWNGGVKIAVKTSQTVGVYMNVAGVSATPELKPVDETHFYVLKLELDEGPDTISIFVDPALGVEPESADAVVTTSTDILIDRIRYSLYSDGGTLGGLDEIRVGETFADVTPSSTAAINVAPENKATNVSVDALLEWQVGSSPEDNQLPWDAVVGYYLYFGEEPNQLTLITPEMLSAETTIFDPDLVMDKTYYWQVEEAIENGIGEVYPPGEPNNVMSNIWSFQTLLSVPVINGQPVNLQIDPDTEAVFSVDVSSVSTPHFIWYYSADNVVGDDSPVGGDSPELLLSNVEIADEGYYYCSVINDASVEVVSDMAILKLNRLLSWYQFENNTQDSVGVNGAVVIPDAMTYATGIVTSDDQVYAADPNGAVYLELPEGTYPKAGFGNGIEKFTYSAWIKLADDTQGGSLFGAFNAANNMTVNFAINQNAGDLEFYLRNGGGVSNAVNDISIYDNQWHLVAISNDGSTITSYLDGLPLKSVSHSLSDYKDWEFGVKMLALDYHGSTDKMFNGSVDDLRIYNYDLSSEDIAQMYFDSTGTHVCLYGNPFADLTGDCVVDLADIALISQSWLDDGFYPLD